MMTPTSVLPRLCVQALISLPQITAPSTWKHPQHQQYICGLPFVLLCDFDAVVGRPKNFIIANVQWIWHIKLAILLDIVALLGLKAMQITLHKLI